MPDPYLESAHAHCLAYLESSDVGSLFDELLRDGISDANWTRWKAEFPKTLSEELPRDLEELMDKSTKGEFDFPFRLTASLMPTDDGFLRAVNRCVGQSVDDLVPESPPLTATNDSDQARATLKLNGVVMCSDFDCDTVGASARVAEAKSTALFVAHVADSCAAQVAALIPDRKAFKYESVIRPGVRCHVMKQEQSTGFYDENRQQAEPPRAGSVLKILAESLKDHILEKFRLDQTDAYASPLKTLVGALNHVDTARQH